VIEFHADPATPYHMKEFDDKGRPMILYCKSGGRSALATATLLEMGFTDVAHLDGGITAWKDAQRPVRTFERDGRRVGCRRGGCPYRRLRSMTETNRHHFLADPPPTEAAERLLEEDAADGGYVMNLTRIWAYEPAAMIGLFDVLGVASRVGDLSRRQRGILVSACASTLGDAYCSLAWGTRLAAETAPAVAAGVLHGDDSGLDAPERAMARWARKVAAAPITTDEADVAELRDFGFSDRQIFAMTVYTAMRVAFSTVNNALGARPDRQLADSAPPAVVDAVDFGRPVALQQSEDR
jgi:alkylhydroperoxidase family enzyme